MDDPSRIRDGSRIDLVWGDGKRERARLPRRRWEGPRGRNGRDARRLDCNRPGEPGGRNCIFHRVYLRNAPRIISFKQTATNTMLSTIKPFLSVSPLVTGPFVPWATVLQDLSPWRFRATDALITVRQIISAHHFRRPACSWKFQDAATPYEKTAYIWRCSCSRPFTLPRVIYLTHHFPVWSRGLIRPG